MQTYITIFINGEAFNCYEDMSLEDILLYLNININNVVIEYNNNIIVRDRFNTTFFQTSDKIEVITIVGGG